MDSTDLMMAFPVVGLAVGSIWGTMTSQISFAFTIMSLVMVFFAFWKGISVVSFGLLGLSWGAVFGAMAGVVPFDFVALAWIGTVMTEVVDSGAIQSTAINPTRLFILPLVVITLGGIVYTAAPDFAPVAGSPFATGWVGCVNTCQFGSISTLFTSSIFTPLTTGDLCCDSVSFVSGLFTTMTGLQTLFSAVIGFILVLLGLGIGGSFSALVASIGISINDAGARLCQALGIAMVLFAAVNGVWGAWVPTLFSNTWQLGNILSLILPAVCFYGAYLRATVIAE